MKRLLLRTIAIATAAFALVCALAALAIYIGHPNDQRMERIDPASLTPLDAQKRLVGGFFDRKSNLQSSISHDDYKRAVEDAALGADMDLRLMPEELSPHPLALYAVLGYHPDRLEGRRAVLIPSGESLTVRSPRNATTVSLAGSALLGETTLAVSAPPHTEPWTGTLSAPGTRADDSSFWFRNIDRFLSPDQDYGGGRWQEHVLPVRGARSIKLTCTGESGDGCLISEPRFLGAAPARHSSSRRNLLFILVDTMRYDAVSADTAPALSRFAAESFDFRFTHAAGNMTSPSTNALLSCVMPSKLGRIAFSYGVGREQRAQHYKKNEPSFPEHFARAGFRTAMIGNVSIISELRDIGIDHGFRQQIAAERDAYDTPRITREALSWLQRHGNEPFFLYLHYHAPHAPYRPPLADLADTYQGLSDLSSYPSALKWLYRGVIHYTDRHIADLLDGLKALGLDGSTTVVLTADHGDHHRFESFDANEAGPALEGAFFDHGATLREDEIRVPLLIRDPGVKAGASDEASSGLDVAPTLLSLFDLRIPRWCDGLSLVPQMRRPGRRMSRTIGFEGFKRRGILDAAGMKYVRQYEPTQKRLFAPGALLPQTFQLYTSESLYNLKEDPEESTELCRSRPRTCARLRAAFARYYELEARYELTVASPPGSELFVRGLRTVTDEDWTKVAQSRRTYKRVSGETPVTLLSTTPFPRNFYIQVNGKPLRASFTSARLPLKLADQAHLPVEAKRLPFAETDEEPWAVIRRVSADRDSGYQLKAGDPKIEQMMRDWGYLADQ